MIVPGQNCTDGSCSAPVRGSTGALRLSVASTLAAEIKSDASASARPGHTLIQTQNTNTNTNESGKTCRERNRENGISIEREKEEKEEGDRHIPTTISKDVIQRVHFRVSAEEALGAERVRIGICLGIM